MQKPICAILFTLAALTAQAAQVKPQAGKSAAVVPEVVPVPLSESVLKIGLWEQTITREIPGTPYRRTESSRDCYGPGGAPRTTTAVLPKSTEDGQSCHYLERRLEGEVLRWDVACSGKGGSVQGPASITFTDGAYSGSATLQRKAGGKVTKMVDTYEGKWVAACQ